MTASMWRTTRLISVALAISSLALVSSLEFKVEHSVDSGSTWHPLGTIEGDAKTGLVLSRQEHSGQNLQELKALADADGFYKVRIASSVASVRATCYAASDVTESMALVVEGRDVLGVAYQVQSTGCGKKAAATPVSLPHRELPVVLRQTSVGPILNAHHNDADAFTSNGIGSMGAAGSVGGQQQEGQQQRGGAANRPMGVAPGSTGSSTGAAGNAGNGQPPPDQTWLQKNWMYVLGGVMVVLNVMGSAAKVQQQAAPGGVGAAAPARR